MTLYITPFGRLARQRMIDRWGQPHWTSMVESDVVFPVDVEAHEDEYIVRAMLPGIKPEDLNIQIVNETVSINGTYPEVNEKASSEYLLHEFPTGEFNRVLTLPVALDAGHAEATMENGVLSLRVPKAETARPKNIKIQTHKTHETPEVHKV
ncbi:MAG: Hsp20/alpha crystallin family protein [Chloroflexi bacterium]|nr:Hsp20/alpha crystallin family protein [Chloroflexota bacterium]